MPNPSDAYTGRSAGSEVRSRRGVGQFRREWEAVDPHASVLILHGIAEHSGRYEHVGSTFADAGYAARGIDHHGFGRSGGRRGHVDSWEVYLDDVEDNLAELRELGLPVVLCGHSMGGLMAYSYAVSDRPQPDVYLLSGPALGAIVPRWQRVIAPILGRIAPRLFIKSPFDGDLLSTDPDADLAQGIQNIVESACGERSDCNGNGLPDSCDLDDLTSADCDLSGVPDEVQSSYRGKVRIGKRTCADQTHIAAKQNK